MPQPLVILGGAGSGAIVAEAVRAAGDSGPYTLIGFLNDMATPETTFAGKPVLGPFAAWRDCPADAVFIGAFPKVKQALARHRRLTALEIPDDRWATVFHPGAYVAKDVIVGPGSFVGAGAVIEPGLAGSRHVCIRGGSYISHDVRLGEFVFVGPNATILGRCTIDEGSHIAANAVCREETRVGRYALVGIGAVVVADAPDFAILVGNPARIIGRLNPD